MGGGAICVDHETELACKIKRCNPTVISINNGGVYHSSIAYKSSLASSESRFYCDVIGLFCHNSFGVGCAGRSDVQNPCDKKAN